MRRILTTTAIVALSAMPLYAEQHTGNTTEAAMQVTAGDQEFRASTMMGAKVYMPAKGESQKVADMDVSEVPDNWTEIGSVEDVFVGQNGKIATVVFSPNDEISSDRDRVGLKTASVEFKKASQGDELYVVYTGDKVTLEDSAEFDQASAEAEGQTSAADMQKEQQQASADDKTKTSDDKKMEQAANAETEQDGLTIRAAALTGHTVYVPAEGKDASNIKGEMPEASGDWEKVGEVGNVVLSREGEIKSVTLDAGGFLGMGEKEVETSMDDLRFVRDSDADADNEFFIVFTGDRAQFDTQDEFDRTKAEANGDWVMTPEDSQRAENTKAEDGSEERDMAQNDAAATEDAQKDQTAQNDMAKDQSNEDQMAEADTEAGDTMQMTEDQMAKLTADELEGQTVYGTNGDNIGDVSTLVLDDSGEIDKVIVDVGGFLGIGEKPVALPFDDLRIEQSSGSMNSIQVTTDHTQADLENMKTWEDA